MGLLMKALNLLLLSVVVSNSEIILTQSPASMATSQGEKVTITCSISSSVSSNNFHWYQKKPGTSPKLLIYGTSNLASGIPTCFSGSGSGTTYSLTISSMEAEDSAIYYCQQKSSVPFTQFYKAEQKPLSPSQDQVASPLEDTIWYRFLSVV